MDIDTTGWLDIATRVPSPNQDKRPPGVMPEIIVVHAISLPPGEFGGPWIDRLFTNTLPAEGHPFFAEIQGLTVSAHVLIRRDGETVQYVPFLQRAWHAGVSSFRGRERCNDFSIGIELEGSDVHPFTGVQYERLAQLITALKKTYPGLANAPVVGHADIAPGRKTDPGPCFEWSRLQVLLGA
ncbi:N-acetylmuramoyl-L-alanine amidase [Ectothiorhodospira shaposhnikovii]|uniref:1,6-anhydro-N-acetylmuramyl-L-alanine amidase AmpD n=1 Tax=Ectothiorhodospira shaposhnikovii TaxID=1054 RepID=UPI001905AEFA|nr:1,6-anhydro-N-acetylmuramyl-L-alanine amidase AmpD [Ectothiorhodospira shaposhnikovii]MBK1672820.1 N-acetylmuramoyl-L-alanine amidase [Ectothiorhodospira shaposhnikovii]